MKPKAFIYFHPRNAYEAKELAGRVRADGAHAVMIDASKVRTSPNDIAHDVNALILDQALGNAAAILRAHEAAGLDVEVHYVKKDEGTNRYEFIDEKVPADPAVSTKTKAPSSKAGAPDNPELASTETAADKPETDED